MTKNPTKTTQARMFMATSKVFVFNFIVWLILIKNTNIDKYLLINNKYLSILNNVPCLDESSPGNSGFAGAAALWCFLPEIIPGNFCDVSNYFFVGGGVFRGGRYKNADKKRMTIG